ncbi:MAG: CPBP family intramembrane glutamic endopeptidase [Candidatus Eisenbacteria bacterium]
MTPPSHHAYAPDSPGPSSVTPPDDAFAESLRGFGVVGILAAVVVLVVGGWLGPLRAVPALLWTWRSRTPWREIGYVRPRSWIGGLLVGVAGGVAFKFVLKAVVMPLLGADPINHAYHFMVGNTSALPFMVLLMIAGGGIGEETVFRGFLFERLGKLLGTGAAARVATVLITTTLFSAAHYPEQGLAGSAQALITGSVFGAVYAVTRRLWPLMCAHAAFDLAALAIIYWNRETDVAHLIFK